MCGFSDFFGVWYIVVFKNFQEFFFAENIKNSEVFVEFDVIVFEEVVFDCFERFSCPVLVSSYDLVSVGRDRDN